MSEHLKSNPQLDEALNSCQDASQLREIMLQTLASTGQIVRTRDDAFNIKTIPQPQSEASLPANGFRYEREVHFAQSTGKRSLVIRANTQADLNELERQVTGQ
jgi:hypothetical protein